MSTTNYRLLNNSFESGTRKSHIKAVKLSTDTTDKLRGLTDPDLAAIFTAYEPFHETYITLNVAIEMAEGVYKGKTSSFESILDTLPDKLRMWEPPVYALFPEDSSVALEIFPQKRSPFLQGPYDGRLISVRVLRDNLLNYTVANPTLVPVQANVAAFYTLANTARQTQQSREGSLDTLRHQRDLQRVTTMNAYWGLVYGGLLRKYYNDPEAILGFIDLDDFYDNATEEPTIIRGTINSGQVVNINALMEQFNLGTASVLKLRVTEPTNGSLVFYSAVNPTDAPTPTNPYQFTVNTGAELEKTIGNFNFQAQPNFNIFNPTPLTGAWEIEITE